MSITNPHGCKRLFGTDGLQGTEAVWWDFEIHTKTGEQKPAKMKQQAWNEQKYNTYVNNKLRIYTIINFNYKKQYQI